MNSEMSETSKTILSALAAADSGEICMLPIAWDLYPEESLAKVAETFASYCETEIGRASDEAPATLAIRVREEHRRESRKIIGSFLSSLLDHATRIRLQAEAEK